MGVVIGRWVESMGVLIRRWVRGESIGMDSVGVVGRRNIHRLPFRSNVCVCIIMRLSMLDPTPSHLGQGGEFSLFGMAGLSLPQGSGY